MIRATRGRHWESMAESFLRERGLRVLKRNYRCRLGEIDLVAEDAAHIVFVEVRYRRRTDFGSGAETVAWSKQQRILRAAGIYLQRHPAHARRHCRFDVVSIRGTNTAPEFDWITNAFEARG